jgi:hypothetical protein
MARNNLYSSFTQEDINEYISCIRTKSDLYMKIHTIRSCMVEAEKCYALRLLSKEEHAASVSKLTVLFKTLLIVKEQQIETF